MLWKPLLSVIGVTALFATTAVAYYDEDSYEARDDGDYYESLAAVRPVSPLHVLVLTYLQREDSYIARGDGDYYESLAAVRLTVGKEASNYS